MQGLRLFAVGLLVFGVVEMSSARYQGARKNTKSSSDPLANMEKGEFKENIALKKLAKDEYTGDTDDLYTAHLTGTVDEEINRENKPSSANPKATTAKPAAVKGKPKAGKAKASPAASKARKH